MMRVAIRTVADSNNTISADFTGISKCAVGRDGVVRQKYADTARAQAKICIRTMRSGPVRVIIVRERKPPTRSALFAPSTWCRSTDPRADCCSSGHDPDIPRDTRKSETFLLVPRHTWRPVLRSGLHLCDRRTAHQTWSISSLYSPFVPVCRQGVFRFSNT